MVYGTLAEVKRLVGMDPDNSGDDRFDDILNQLLEKASRYIDASLRKYETVPIVSPDAIINEIAEDYAACYYQENQAGMGGLVEKRSILCARGKEKLKAYIDGKYYGSGTPGEGRENCFGKVDYVYQDENYGLDNEDYY